VILLFVHQDLFARTENVLTFALLIIFNALTAAKQESATLLQTLVQRLSAPLDSNARTVNVSINALLKLFAH